MSSPFDKAKYKALLEGLEISEVRYRDALVTDISGRLDSTFFIKDYVRLRKTARKWEPFGEKCRRIVCGPFGSTILDTAYQSFGIPMIRPFNLRGLRTDAGEIVYLSPTFVKNSGLKLFPAGTIMFARVGDAGCGMTTFEQSTISPNIIAAQIIEEKCNPSFATIFFNTRFGMTQMTSAMKAVAQPTISTEIIRSARIPSVSREFQDGIAELHHHSLRLENESRHLYSQAEQTLLDELGLNNWQPPEPLTYTRRAKDVFAAARNDAEYFRPKYDGLLSRLRQAGVVRLGDAVTMPIRRGVSPEYAETGDYIVINSKHVGKVQVELDDNRKTTTAFVSEPLNRRALVRKHDVLLNSTGCNTIGRCQTLLNDVNAIADNHVAIVRPKKTLDPVYLGCFLNAMPGQWQSERGWTGSSGQIELRPDVIADYLIWDAPMPIQLRVRKFIEDSHAARRKADQLLARAKHAVELAIEQDEAAAMRFLNELPALPKRGEKS